MDVSKATEWAWQVAANEAFVGNAREIEPAHFLIGMTKLCDVDVQSYFPDMAIRDDVAADVTRIRSLFARASFDYTTFRRQLRQLVGHQEQPVLSDGKLMHRSVVSKHVFARATSLAADEKAHLPLVRLHHLLQAVLESGPSPWQNLLDEMGKSDLSALLFGEGNQRPTPTLDHYGRDLTALAAEGRLDPVIGRDREIRELARALIGQRKRNAILVGEAGVGKTSIVEGLAQQIAGSIATPMLQGARVIEVPLNALMSGAVNRGMFEERLDAVIKEAGAGDNIILFFDEIHTLLGAGGHAGSAADAAQILKPALARGEVCCIGATTIAEYRASIEKDAALARRFQVIHIDEPDRAATLSILSELRQGFAHHYHVTVTDEALEAAVDLSRRYLPDQRLPDKAITLIEQACARVVVPSIAPWSARPDASDIGREEIAVVVAARCRIPVEQLTADETQRLLSMEDVLRRRVIGQDEAVGAVADVVRRARVGLNDPRRPLGVFLFAGATGTGKTELAKTLAEFLFHDEERMIRLDMSEYQDQYTVSRLIGAPPGYIGYDEEGQLTKPVRTNPYSVVLFDEIEKAHPKILDILLQMLDEGHLSDAHGRRVSFKETVIILTSNLGAQVDDVTRHAGVGFATEAAGIAPAVNRAYRERIMAALREKLRPELLNRIGRVVMFQPLDRAVVRGILDKTIDKLSARGGLRARNIRLVLTEDAYALLLEEGFDPQFGAREMERTVDRLLTTPLSTALLEGRLVHGSTMHVEVSDGQLVFVDQDTLSDQISGLEWAP